MDAVAVDRVHAAAAADPDSPTARTGFADRATAAGPEVPGWIWWLIENVSQDTARFLYQIHYPREDPGRPDRALFAERAARGLERARRAGYRNCISAQTPELPDDEDFHNLGRGQQWGGHWYSRETREQWFART